MQFNRRQLLITSAAGASAAALGLKSGVFAQDGDKPTVRVGSKNFTESIILAEMLAALMEDAGYSVEKQNSLGGTVVVHEAMVNGDLDMYLEYTGTGLIAILGEELPEQSRGGAAASPAAGATPDSSAGQDAVYDIVAEAYPDAFGLEWLEPWGFNNTYVLAVRPETAEEYGLEKNSDLQGAAGDLVFGCSQEFLARPDGLPALQETYGMEFADAIGLEPALVYAALDEGQVEVIAGAATEGHIERLGFVKLEDDMNFFPPYYAAPVVRQELLEASPEVREILNQLSGQIDDQTMGNLNLEVDEEGRNAIDVARDFLVTEGYIDE